MNKYLSVQLKYAMIISLSVDLQQIDPILPSLSDLQHAYCSEYIIQVYRNF